MRNTRELKRMRRNPTMMRAAWMFFAGAALLASCAAPPNSGPAAAQTAQPVAAQPSDADQPQPMAAAPAKTEALAAPPQEAAPPAAEPQRAEAAEPQDAQAASLNAAPVEEAEPASPPAPAAAQPAPDAANADQPNAGGWTLAARAPRRQEQPSEGVKPADNQPPTEPEPEPAAPNPRATERDDASPSDQPVATGGEQERPRIEQRQQPAQARPTARTPATKTDAGCGPKGQEPDPRPSAEGPQPRWVCREPKITAERVWSGQSVDFVFAIANEGEGDLKIKLKKP